VASLIIFLTLSKLIFVLMVLSVIMGVIVKTPASTAF
jgi:hypothetical protein